MDGYYTYPGNALTPSTFHHDVSGEVYPAQVVVENRTTYFDHEDRIKALEKKLETMTLETRSSKKRISEDEDSEDASEDEEIEFRVGDEVQGLYKNGRWYTADIAEVQDDGRYLLNWHDGDTVDRVKAANQLRKIASAPNSFQVGIEMKGMPLSKLRTRYELSNSDFSDSKLKKIVYLIQWIADEAVDQKKVFEEGKLLPSQMNEFQPGEKVEARYRNGRWYSAKIAEKRSDGMFQLDWDDGDQGDRTKAAQDIRRALWKEINHYDFLLLSVHKFNSSGDDFSGVPPPGHNIRKICCRAGLLVDRIRFIMADGSFQDWGGNGGEECTPFVLNDDEVLTEIEVKHREWASHKGQTLLGSVRFTTSSSRTSDWFGNPGYCERGEFAVATSKANPIVSLVMINPSGFCSGIKAARLASGVEQKLDTFESLQSKRGRYHRRIDLGPDRLDEPKFSIIRDQFEGESDQGLRLKVELLREKGGEPEEGPRPARARVFNLELRFKHDANGRAENEISTYAKPGLKEEFDLIEASDKVITLLSRITLSNKWAGCSRNIYGFLIRNVLLGGSVFEGQVVPNTQSVLPLSVIGVLLAFGMQFALAWYLWSNLPFNQGSENPSLSKVWDPDQDAFPKYSICRTHPLVQVICIGLFLFYMLNSTPSLIKNALIILWSSKFVSRDINGVTRIHYWRTSSFWSGMLFVWSRFLNKCHCIPASRVFTPFPMEIINWDVLTYFRDSRNFFLPLRRSLFSWSMMRYTPIKDEEKKDWEAIEALDWVQTMNGEEFEESDTRLSYELQETRTFIRRKLKEINPETFQVEDDDQDEQDKENSESVMEVMNIANPDRKLMKFKEQLTELAAEENKVKIIRTAEASNYLVAQDYCDGDLPTEVKRIKGGYHALLRSSFAFTFGIVPEVTATIMILICGVQYILWSGSKVGSDTNGLEEIILATVAIVFINEIDEALYEHAMPELYKTAHDRDEFNLENWIPAQEPAEMEDQEHRPPFWWPFGRFECWPRNQPDIKGAGAIGGEEQQKSSGNEAERERQGFTMEDFHSCMRVGDNYSHMSSRQHSDLHFARQYPFLYARKYKYFFQEHFFEGFIWAYGSWGVHVLVLTAMALAIVGGFRNAHQCTGSNGVFSQVKWPGTCDTWTLTTTGTCI